MIASIYKLTDNNNYVYYGSSTNVRQRFSAHKSGSGSMSRLMDKASMKMEILEEYYFDVDTYNKKFILNRERYYIENFDCINCDIPGLTSKEYRERNKEKIKEYREKHREEHNEHQKKYAEKHKEKITEKNKKYREKHKEEKKQYLKEYREKHKEKRNEKHDCACGGKYTFANKIRHLKSLKHLKYINTSST